MRLNNKFFLRTYTGIKKGVITPTLPKFLLDFQNKPLIRIFRVLGGLNILNLLGGNIIVLQGFLLYFSMFWAFLFLISHIYLSIHRYIYIKKIIKNKDLEIKNSPLDTYATLLAIFIVYCKGAYEYAIVLGVGLGLILVENKSLIYYSLINDKNNVDKTFNFISGISESTKNNSPDLSEYHLDIINDLIIYNYFSFIFLGFILNSLLAIYLKDFNIDKYLPLDSQKKLIKVLRFIYTRFIRIWSQSSKFMLVYSGIFLLLSLLMSKFCLFVLTN